MKINALNFVLRLATRILRFVRPFVLHLVAGLILLSMLLHLNHLLTIQRIRSAAGRVQGALVQIESSQRLFIITGNADALRKYEFYRRILGARLLDLCRLIPASPSNVNLCRETNKLIEAKLSEMSETIRLVRAGRLDETTALVKSGIGERLTDQIERNLDLIRIEETGGGVTPVACVVP